MFDDIEKVMPHLANELLPAWLAGIFVSGAIAAMMSTADSQLLVISSSIIEDFFHQTLDRNVGDASLLKASRIITIVVGLDWICNCTYLRQTYLLHGILCLGRTGILLWSADPADCSPGKK